MRKQILSLLALVFAAGATPALAQFTLRVQQGANLFPTSSGRTLSFNAPGMGQTAVLTLTGIYTGATSAVISSPQIVGASDFSAGTLTTSAPTLQPGDNFTLTITYTASTTTGAVAQLVIPFFQTAAVAGQSSTSGSITFTLSGTAPSFSVNYLLAPNNNVTPLSTGGTIPFPATVVKSTATATVVIADQGSGPGTLNSVTITGAAFQLQGLPLLPLTFSAGATLSIGVLYSPVNPGTDTGTLTIAFPGQTIVVNLVGTATSSVIGYSEINGTTVTPLTVGQQINVPDTPIGVLSTVSIQVQNTGTAATTINSIGLTGNAFALANVPPLPAALAPGASITFTVNFNPAQAGPSTGTLTINSDRFQLAGNGIGVQLAYAYTSGSSGVPVTVQPQGTVLFSSVPLAQRSVDVFTVTNTGTTATQITSIGIAGAAGAFSLQSQPALPIALAPGASYSFSIVFTPAAQGLNTANLVVNSQTFLLSAFGTTVPAFPAYQITGSSGQVQPFTQPAVGLTLSQPYALNATGSLNLNVSSGVFATDPSVQFATGGRAVTFTIAAGSTQAVFANGSTQIQLQSGTVAESISLNASFSADGVDVTPANVAPLVLTVGRSAPLLMSVVQQNFAANGFQVVLQGYSTTRTLTKVNLQFAGVAGFALSGASVTVDVSASAGFWYSSAVSTPFGGFFSITIPVTVTVTKGTALTSVVGDFMVTATVANEVGTSNSVTQ